MSVKLIIESTSMYKLKFTIISLLLGMVLVSAQAAQKEPVMQRVYMFGFGASLTDSIACQTAVQAVDSAWLDTHKLLVDRSLYSIQLQFYIEQNEGVKHPLCTIYFDRNERKVQKMWNKMKKRYDADPNIKLRQIDPSKFQFMAEQYIPPTIGELPVGATETATKQDKKGDKDKKK